MCSDLMTWVLGFSVTHMMHYYAVLDKDFVNEECNILCPIEGMALGSNCANSRSSQQQHPMHLGPHPHY